MTKVRRHKVRKTVPAHPNLAGDTDSDKKVWHSYLRMAWDAYHNWRESKQTGYPGSADFVPMPFECRAKLASIVFSVFALEYRLRSTELNIVRHDLKACGVPEADIVARLEQHREPDLNPLLMGFWSRLAGMRQINSAERIDRGLEDDVIWKDARESLVEAINLRNKFAHGDPVALGMLLPLDDDKQLLAELTKRAREYYNAVIDMMAFINYHSRYSELDAMNKSWASVQDALKFYAKLKMA